MIIFNSQEEFENAVMAVLVERLRVDVDISDAGYYPRDGKTITAALEDSKEGIIANDSEYLPMPTINY